MREARGGCPEQAKMLCNLTGSSEFDDAKFGTDNKNNVIVSCV